ncbi:unnamed protein product [Bursaphelenchus xylophilus]|uniref:(pine wood nematode) hypothetical protein n=1 Tax=Bursaphelenchus xylophilus TaxID=6326 RepID=A0A1I7RWH4_BURXY|nr:unnamed protein product [Bursaphelenchus xylophilus]CAG9128379.1 unnamed protein product [Bursaphelenchus xylophilus]
MLQLLAICLAFLSAFALYDDNLARDKFIGLALGAHVVNGTVQSCLDKVFDGDVQVHKTYSVPCNNLYSNETCLAYIAIYKKSQAIVIGFRGTVSGDQFKEEVVKTLFRPQVRLFHDKVLVAQYFAETFNLFWSKTALKNDLLKLELLRLNSYRIWITGHSLGGAIAALTATQLALSYPLLKPRISLYTFGQPRVGNREYAALHNLEVEESYRVVHNQDLVPNIPFPLMNYYHHDNEIYYKNDMSVKKAYAVCSAEDQSKLCQGGNQPSMEIKDHLNYFGIDVEKHCDEN